VSFDGMPFKQDPLPQQAADLAVLYELNFVRAEDVVTWADCLIASLDSPGSDLIDLSCAGNDPGGIHRRLAELAKGADRELAFRRALIEVHDRLRDGAIELRWVVQLLYQDLVLTTKLVVPDEVSRFVSWADYEYELMDDGIKAGNIEKIRSDTLTLLNELGRGHNQPSAGDAGFAPKFEPGYHGPGAPDSER